MLKYDDLDLVALEVMMLECAEDDDAYITESFENYIIGIGGKILNELKKIIDAMIQFVKEIKTDLVILSSKMAMQAKLHVLKVKAKNGESVSIPDFKKIESVYANAGDILPKELKKLLKSAYPIRTSSDLQKFEEKKTKFENSLIEVENELENIMKTSKTYSANDAYNMINKLLTTESIYIKTYYKAIREFEQLKNQYDNILKDVSRKNNTLGKKSIAMHKSLVAKTSTSLSRMLKKSIFLVSSIIV